MLWIALAAQLTAPTAIDFQSWLSPSDCPPWLTNGLWEVAIRVTVNSDGRADHCDIDFNGGNQQLADYTCNLIVRRARFEPARLQNGSPTYGVYRNSVFWAKPQPYKRRPPAADLEVTVDRLPSGLRWYIVDAVVDVDANGQLSACNVDPREPSRGESLFPLVCARLLESYKAKPARINGQLVQSMQVARVRFKSK